MILKSFFCFLIAALIFLSFSPTVGAFGLQPKKIIIPSLNIDLDVHKARIIFDTWEVNLYGASFGENSALPGNKGNTVIFSHTTDRLFGRLDQIKKGDDIHIFTDLDWFTYEVVHTEIVNPEDIEVLDVHNDYELTLYTCTKDPTYSKRFVVKAVPSQNFSRFEK